MLRRTVTLVWVVGVLAAACQAGDAGTRGRSAERDKSVTQAVRYLGWKKGQFHGRRCMVLLVAPAKGRKTLAIAVPNKNPRSPMMDPPPHVVEFVKKLRRGDIIEVTTAETMGKPFLKSFRGIRVAADLPEYFTVAKIGQKKVGLQRYLCVTVKKGDETADLLVPNKKGPEGKWVSDEKIAAQVKEFREGSRVDVEVRKAGRNIFLKAIYPHAEAQTARFVKRDVKEIDGQRHVCAVVKTDAGERALAVPNSGKDRKGNPAPDVKLAAAVNKLRPGQTVRFKTRTDGGQEYLREIEVTRAPPEEKPKDKPKGRRG